MNQTLAQQAFTRNNDYSHLEAIYHLAASGELVRDPYRAERRAKLPDKRDHPYWLHCIS